VLRASDFVLPGARGHPLAAVDEPMEQIRDLQPEEYPQALALWEAVGLHSVRPEGRDSPEALARQYRLGVTRLIGSWVGDELACVVIASHEGRKGWINRLATSPAHQRKGYARKLLAAAEDWLRSEGIEVMAALIEDYNQPSLTLFESEGYNRHNDIYYLTKRDRPEA
jgi:GNAT superfamily N-acetyltransferase